MSSSTGDGYTLPSAAGTVDGAEKHLEEKKSDGGEEDGHVPAMEEHLKPALRKGGGVSFGSVRVHKHNLTMGDNPSAHTFGPPLTLDWEVAESQRFSNVDEFSLEYHGRRESQVVHHKAEVIQGGLRQQIAAMDHSAGSIRKLQAEVFEVRQHRKESAAEDPTQFKEEELSLDPKSATKKKAGRGLFRSFFHK